jgi:hypothetical protein
MLSWLQSLQNACIFYRRGAELEEGNFTIKTAVASAVIQSFEITPSEVKVKEGDVDATPHDDNEGEGEWTSTQDDDERVFGEPMPDDDAEKSEAATCPPAARLAEKR